MDRKEGYGVQKFANGNSFEVKKRRKFLQTLVLVFKYSRTSMAQTPLGQ